MQELFRARRVAVIAAHPDDEVIGAGMLLMHLPEVFIIHTTDGSPLDLSDALRSGFESREEYATARRKELACALHEAGVPEANVISLGFTDKETVHHLPGLCGALTKELSRLKPDAILTQPYEGGHPDHDSAAFAADRCVKDKNTLFEMTSYHAYNGNLRAGCFLPGDVPEVVRDLAPEDAVRKERMLQCFRSQAAVLQYFPVVPERFRRAPRYDFSRPPHAGRLHYESLPWGMSGSAWRESAARC